MRIIDTHAYPGFKANMYLLERDDTTFYVALVRWDVSLDVVTDDPYDTLEEAADDYAAIIGA